MYTYMYTYAHVHIHVHGHICIYIDIYICKYIQVNHVLYRKRLPKSKECPRAAPMEEAPFALGPKT